MKKITLTEKKCSKCKITKPAAEFTKHSSNKSGLQPQCKICDKENRARQKAKHPEKLKEAQKKYCERNKEKVKATNKAWKLKNPEKVAAAKAKYREKLKALPKTPGKKSTRAPERILDDSGTYIPGFMPETQTPFNQSALKFLSGRR
jgi:hypothetical protein